MSDGKDPRSDKDPRKGAGASQPGQPADVLPSDTARSAKKSGKQSAEGGGVSRRLQQPVRSNRDSAAAASSPSARSSATLGEDVPHIRDVIGSPGGSDDGASSGKDNHRPQRSLFDRAEREAYLRAERDAAVDMRLDRITEMLERIMTSGTPARENQIFSATIGAEVRGKARANNFDSEDADSDSDERAHIGRRRTSEAARRASAPWTEERDSEAQRLRAARKRSAKAASALNGKRSSRRLSEQFGIADSDSARGAPSSAEHRSARAPTLTTTKTLSSSSHIVLNDVGVASVLKWLDDIAYWQTSEPGQVLTLSLKLSPRIRSRLRAKFAAEIPSDTDLYALSNRDLLDYLQRLVKPESKQEGYLAFDSDLSFRTRSGFALDPMGTNFEEFYPTVLKFCEECKRRYRYLFYENLENAPELTTKFPGLLNSFLKKFPGEFGYQMYNTIPYGTRWTSFDRFIEDFLVPCEIMYAQAQAWGKQKSILLCTKGSSASAKTSGDAPTAYAAPKTSSFYPSRRPPAPPASASARINALDQDMDHSDSGPDEPALDERKPSGDPSDDDSDGDEFEYERTVQECLDHARAAEQAEQRLSAIDSARGRGSGTLVDPRAKAPSKYTAEELKRMPCFKLMNTGNCASGAACAYSHDAEVLRERKEQQDEAQRKKGFGPKPPKRPGRFLVRDLCNHKISALNAVLGTEAPHPGADLHHCVKREGYLHVPGIPLRAVDCLFDSGAQHASYISRAYLELVRDKVQHLIRPVSGTVLMANGKDREKVSEQLLISISFVSDAGIPYCVDVALVVITTHQSVIIGLPDLVLKLLPLFIDMLERAALTHSEQEFALLELAPQPAIGMELAALSAERFGDLAQYGEMPGQPLIDPWEDPISMFLSEEEEMCPDPASFSGPLHYLSMPWETAKEEYISLFVDHISPAFRKETDIEKLLRSDLALGVFLPREWTGVSGIAPIHLKTLDTMPKKVKPPARPINPKLYANAKKEFDRLVTYFYRKSNSPTASPLCLAFKATAPGIRFCGDYSGTVNPHMATGHWPIPNVKQVLEKIITFRYFLDFDLTNGFHQFLLDDATSALLSVQTPWGQYEPIFLPEGVPQGSGILQEVMQDVYGEFSDWAIVIFDNLLVLANDMADAYVKTEKILHKSRERNMVLKMKKTWLGFEKVTFFGYECTYGSYALSKDRIDSIMAFVMPCSKKSLKRFLGCSGFFQPFMPNYSDLTCQLNEMGHDDFDWDPKTWKCDYVQLFTKFKEAVCKCTALFYPDYNLPWIVRADASDFGVGFVLMQEFTAPTGIKTMQPLLFGSKKFSETALKWHTYAKEGFAQFFSMKSCDYYLRAKPFVFEGDHANLQWIERSTDAKVVRWKIFMQSFIFLFRHIKGLLNYVADWESRFHCLQGLYLDPAAVTDDNDESSLYGLLHSLLNAVDRDPATLLKPFTGSTELLSPRDMLATVHGGRSGHMGVRRIKDLLNRHYPGHGISDEVITEFRAGCPVCQKNDTAYAQKVLPKPRHLKNEGPGRVVGIDFLSLPKDIYGNNGAYVLRDHCSRLLGIYATPDRDETSASLATFCYVVTYGAPDVLISDPGSELMSAGVAQLNNWFGIHHRVSLIDRHESNGVEGANKQIIRHLSNLLLDERIKDTWSSPHILKWVEFIMNSFDIDESGVSAYTLTFGTESQRHFEFPKGPLDSANASAYLKILDQSLTSVRAITREFQDQLVKKRVPDGPQNLYAPGEFVLFELPRDKPRPHKLHAKYLGPYEVIQQTKNDVEVRHLSLGVVKTFYVGDLKYYRGSRVSAVALASTDADQFVVTSISAFQGDPWLRTDTSFLVNFADGDTTWMPWSRDLFDSVGYETFCSSRPYLRPLLLTATEATRWKGQLKRKAITAVKPGDTVYVDLRSYGSDWYRSLDLPDLHTHCYYAECIYEAWTKEAQLLTLHCPTLGDRRTVDHVFVNMYGSVTAPPTLGATSVNMDLLAAHPCLQTRTVIAKTAADYAYLVGQQYRDDENKRMYSIIRVYTDTGNNIVASVAPVATRGRPAKPDARPIHIWDIVRMLKATERT